MKTDSIVRIYCATCPESLELYYSHGSLAAKTLADDIKHDATVSSDWHFRDGMFYCDTCGEAAENDREQAKTPMEINTDAWRRIVAASKNRVACERVVPYADAVRDCLNGEG